MNPQGKVVRHKPLFAHDCDWCQYLGSFQGADLYVHVSTENLSTTVIERYSSDGPDYQSGWTFSYGQSKGLTEARNRAVARGFISPQKADELRKYYVPPLRRNG